MRKTAILVIILCGFAVAGAGKQKPKGQLVASAQAAAMTSATGAHGAAAQAMSPEQVQALKDDLARMRVLVQQMETNLNFVDTTQTPLKHQFQLEIDMWKVMIQQMERRLPK